LANLRTQVEAIQNKIEQNEREKNILQSMLISGTDAPTVEADTGTEAEPGGNPYQGQIEKLQSKLSDLRARYGPAHPDVRRTQDEINRLQAKASVDPGAGAQNNPVSQAELQPQQPAIQPKHDRRNPVLEAQIEKLAEDINDQTKLLKPLQTQIESHESLLEQMPGFEQQIARLQDDYDVLKLQYTGLLEKEKAAEISHALEVHQKGEKFEVLDAAITPNGPASPNRPLISVAGLLGGLILGIGLATAVEKNDESVRTENEAARIFGKPVLSAVPRILFTKERLTHGLRAAGMLAGTLVGSVALGFAFSFLFGRFF
jgi:uncharacterized protein involved in exopolysaccharide biosynthesis